MDVLARLAATAEARKLCWAKTDLEGVDTLTQEIDGLLDDLLDQHAQDTP